MSTIIISNLIDPLKAHVTKHLKSYLQEDGELSPILDEIEHWYDSYRDSLHPELPMWSDLPSSDVDQLFDAWVEASEEFWNQRLTKSDRKTSTLPVSVAQDASSGVDRVFSCLKLIRSYINQLADGPHKTAMTKGWNFMVYGMEDPGTVVLRPDWLKSFTETASPASSAVPSPLVPEVVKAAQGGSVCEVEPLGEIDSQGSLHFR